MVRFTPSIVTLFTLGVASARPLLERPGKRIAQVIADSTAQWEQACLAAGGGEDCNPLSVAAFSTLLAAADPCGQQDAADNQIDLAKKLNNDSEMIRLTQLFRQQPRNAPDSLSVLYCQKAPRNSELNGLFGCQFAGVNLSVFSGNIDVGANGTIPFGLSSALSPAGSCPASSTPVPDGEQLNTLVTDPFGNSSSSGSGGSSASTSSSTAETSTTVASTSSVPSATADTATTSATTVASSSSSDTSFRAENAQDAIDLNNKFATLTADSACNDGEQACVNSGFAQCVSRKWEITSCSSGLVCVALPLVNSRGTSITCDTQADADARITAALGSATSSAAAQTNASQTSTSVSAASPTADSSSSSTSATSSTSSDSSTSFRLQNGKDAQALNKQFASLTASSSCTEGQDACVNGQFAQCVSGSYALTQCSSGLSCFALPLVNKAGTSIACDTQADALSRIQATGATGGIDGS